jgi:hypothetical protein
MVDTFEKTFPRRAPPLLTDTHTTITSRRSGRP